MNSPKACLAPAALLAALMVFLPAGVAGAASVALRGDVPPGAEPTAPVPFCGGVPFPKGALKSADNVRLVAADGKEIPSQAAATAWWPDGSVKWVLVDAVLAPRATDALALEYGPEVKRAAPKEALKVDVQGGVAWITGPGVHAAMIKDGSGAIEECTLGGKPVVAKGKPARLVVNTIRIADGASGKAFGTNRYLCRDPQAALDVGKVAIDEMTVESPGPIRATIRLRGHVLLAHFGAGLPKEVLDREPAGRMPFSMRLSFYAGCPVIVGQHQIIFSGEPDCDFIARWGIELPGQAAQSSTLILEPGEVVSTSKSGDVPVGEARRLFCGDLADGTALIRSGWENRPCAITSENGSAFIDFWPEAAGAWDLRRYSREWAVGESGDTKKPELIQNFARFAARGLAKSHDFVIGGRTVPVESLSGRAVLVAKPSWYAASGALGEFATEQTSGDFAAFDASTRRRIDYYLYSQDLFGWYGKLVYGFWQSRYGEIHRNDRWDNDYGRWGWSLNDGAGRVGHLLMLQYLRTLDRRYLEAGEAFNRINYDTNMIHTQQHLEDSTRWWTVQGCSHRHDAQPFSCPYIGMRGSYPLGQRIVNLLTGDGITADGLDLVADASYHYATDQPWRLANAGDSDGQGAAANALLWKYETTADKKYLDACRTVLDKSGLIPPPPGKDLGYGPSFGLFMAAGEYAELSGDKAFQDRLVECGRLGAKAKDAGEFIYPIAVACRLAKDEALRSALADILKKLAAAPQNSTAELPPAMWPGHAGYRVARIEPNLLRDLPYAMAALAKSPDAADWPKVVAPLKAVPAEAPADWYKPGGAQGPEEKVPATAAILALKPGQGGGMIELGKNSFKATKSLGDAVEVSGASPLAGPIVPYVELATVRDGSPILASKFDVCEGKVTSVGPGEGGALVAAGKAGPAEFVARLKAAVADGVPSVRAEVAIRVPQGSGRVASWGLRVPLKLGSDAHAIQVTTPGRFRLERCRLDQNDEQIPNWLTSEYHWGEGASLWPRWRQAGIEMGPGRSYRLWRANREDTSPLFCDQGEGDSNWLDLTDRGATPRWGLTVRVLRPGPAAGDMSRQAIRANLETGLVEVEFRSAAAAPVTATELVGAADLVFHDGWRAPLSRPELTAVQYEKFLGDLDYGGNYGLFALRFCLSITHEVKGRQWAEKVRDLGIEPREILYGMMFGDGLARHCEKIGVKWDPADLEGSVRRVVEHYK